MSARENWGKEDATRSLGSTLSGGSWHAIGVTEGGVTLRHPVTSPKRLPLQRELSRFSVTEGLTSCENSVKNLNIASLTWYNTLCDEEESTRDFSPKRAAVGGMR